MRVTNQASRKEEITPIYKGVIIIAENYNIKKSKPSANCNNEPEGRPHYHSQERINGDYDRRKGEPPDDIFKDYFPFPIEHTLYCCYQITSQG